MKTSHFIRFMRFYLFFFLSFIFLCIPILVWGQDDGGGFKLDIWQIVSAILGILSAVFGTMLAKAKGKFGKALFLGQQVIEALAAYKSAGDELKLALEDNTVTDAEKIKMKAAWDNAEKEAADVKAAWKDLWLKEGK